MRRCATLRDGRLPIGTRLAWIPSGCLSFEYEQDEPVADLARCLPPRSPSVLALTTSHCSFLALWAECVRRVRARSHGGSCLSDARRSLPRPSLLPIPYLSLVLYRPVISGHLYTSAVFPQSGCLPMAVRRGSRGPRCRVAPRRGLRLAARRAVQLGFPESWHCRLDLIDLSGLGTMSDSVAATVRVCDAPTILSGVDVHRP